MRRMQFPAAIAMVVASTLAAASCADDPFPGLADIQQAELRSDLFTLAGDAMRGRETTTLDELDASTWLAERARAAGLEPAGDDGTYFQWFALRRAATSEASRMSVGSEPLDLWQDFAVMSRTNASVTATVLWVGQATAEDTARYDARGRIVVVVADGSDPPSPARLASRYYVNRAVSRAANPWIREGAAAVVVVADSLLDPFFERGAAYAKRGSVALEQGQELNVQTRAPTLLVPSRVGSRLRAAGVRVQLDVRVDYSTYPSVNVIARVPGTDPALRGQYVLFSSHQDHDGVRADVMGDSIYNGADDNASTSVAILAIGRAFARHPARRSALFVWHGAEERGLHGSNWHAHHPVVPLDSIAAVLNGDMIGRNHPDSASLLGSTPPHRNSTPLVEMALQANQDVSGFALDDSWDSAEHPEGWYFRSDHVHYAQLNVPALFFTTLLHDDYHTQFDNPDRIDYAKLTRMTSWMYATGWLAANADDRPTIDPGFQLERTR